jgi:DNA modification methylase
MDVDLFGNPVEKTEPLKDKFIVPPFSVLDTKQGAWQNRKKKWNGMGIKSELGREAECVPGNFGGELDEQGKDKYGRKPMSGTSIFDPVLCEVMYHWFCPPGGMILDPFAGGSVRGIVASHRGYDYTGIELSERQVLSNRKQAAGIVPDKMPNWIIGDSNAELGSLQNNTFDFLFSCPPYHDLEVYSTKKEDLSAMEYYKFIEVYSSIINKSLQKLKNNSFAVFTVAEIRDKKGLYKNFVSDTKSAFIRNGAAFYNNIILLKALGTAMLRAKKIMDSGRKVVAVHENVLVFYKGDPLQIKNRLKL